VKAERQEYLESCAQVVEGLRAAFGDMRKERDAPEDLIARIQDALPSSIMAEYSPDTGGQDIVGGIVGFVASWGEMRKEIKRLQTHIMRLEQLKTPTVTRMLRAWRAAWKTWREDTP
jgi:hypothetical protein